MPGPAEENRCIAVIYSCVRLAFSSGFFLLQQSRGAERVHITVLACGDYKHVASAIGNPCLSHFPVEQSGVWAMQNTLYVKEDGEKSVTNSMCLANLSAAATPLNSDGSVMGPVICLSLLFSFFYVILQRSTVSSLSHVYLFILLKWMMKHLK